MATNGRLVAGSHKRNEFVLINADEVARVTSVKELSGQICQICGDEIEITDNGEPFVACNECAFPVCRPCYEYERREGNQACPQCKTRYKCIKEWMGMKKRMTPMIWRMKKRMTPMIWRMSLILMTEKTLTTLPRSWLHLALILAVVSQHMFQGSLHLQRWILFLLIKRSLSSPTYGNEDVGISSDKHALIIPPFMGRGKRIHPMSFTDGFMTLPPRPMNPKKDLAVYGYGTVAWKERMEEWKKKQNEKLRVVKHQGGHAGGNNAGDGVDDPDLPM